MKSFNSHIIFHMLQDKYNMLYGHEEKPLSVRDNEVAIAGHTIDNKLIGVRKVPIATCGPNMEELPDFCIKLWNPDGGTTLMTAYKRRKWRTKSIKWKRRKKK